MNIKRLEEREKDTKGKSFEQKQVEINVRGKTFIGEMRTPKGMRIEDYFNSTSKKFITLLFKERIGGSVQALTINIRSIDYAIVNRY